MGVAIMADYNYMKMTAEEIENLFLTTEMHPNSSEGERALHVLTIKYKRMDAERSRRALWISIIALAFSFFSILVNVAKAEEAEHSIIEIVNIGEAGDFLKWGESYQINFATGFMCGVSVAPLYVQEPSNVKHWWSKKRISSHQVAVIIKQYIEGHPEKWHEPLNIIAFTALKEAFNPDAE